MRGASFGNGLRHLPHSFIAIASYPAPSEKERTANQETDRAVIALFPAPTVKEGIADQRDDCADINEKTAQLRQSPTGFNRAQNKFNQASTKKINRA